MVPRAREDGGNGKLLKEGCGCLRERGVTSLLKRTYPRAVDAEEGIRNREDFEIRTCLEYVETRGDRCLKVLEF